MTFGTMPAWEAWTLVSAAAALAVWLFLRRLRPPRVLVASLLLWQRVLDEPRALTLWERIRRAVSLVLTAIVAIALALAMARPAARSAVPGAARGRVLIVLDSSWSMLAHAGRGGSRWSRAVAQARRIAGAESGNPIALATTADGLVEGPTTDGARLEAALDGLAPAGGDATAWPSLAGADAVHFITDGAMPRRLPGGVIVHSVFEPAANVGITAFDVRPPASPANAADAYLEVVNFAPEPRDVRVTLVRGEATVFDRRLSLPRGQALKQVLPLGPGGAAALHARVEAPDDALRIDDEAFAWIAAARPLAVTVVGQQSAWLRPLLAGDPGVAATFTDPSRYGLATGDAPNAAQRAPDLLIFDRWAPRDPPAVPAIYVAPPADLPWLGGTPQAGAAAWDAAEEKRPHWESVSPHPVVRGVDPLTFTIEKARRYGNGALTPVAQSAHGTPLVYVSDTAARRFVVLAFGPGESNLASAPGFPVLMGNAIEWLARPDARPSQAAGLASFSETTARVTGPEGRSVPLLRVPGAALADLRTPGLYVAEGPGSRSTFAVNITDPQVSNTSRTTLASSDRARPVLAGTSGQPWWLYAAAAAFVLILVEWWTWQRRVTV